MGDTSFIIGYEKFLKSLDIVGRGVLTPPSLWRPPILPTCSFFKFCPSPSHFLVISSPTPIVLSVVLFLWLSRWSHIWWAVLLNDDMDLHMLSLGTLLPEGPWCVFYAIIKGSSLLRSDIECGFLLVLWFDITHTQTNRQTHSTLKGQ